MTEKLLTGTLSLNTNKRTNTKINIPFCLASRVVTIVSDPEQQKIRLAELRKFLKRQDYPETVIDNGVERAKSKGPISGSQDRQKSEDSVIPLVSTYNPNNTNMIPFVRSCEPLLKQSSRMKLILDNYKIFKNSKRQAKNLKHLVTKSKFNLILLMKTRVFLNAETKGVKYARICSRGNA